MLKREILQQGMGMLEEKTVRLRGIGLSDADEFVEGWNNMELRNSAAASALGPMSRGEEEEWVRSAWNEARRQAEFADGVHRNSHFDGYVEERMDVCLRSQVLIIFFFNVST